MHDAKSTLKIQKAILGIKAGLLSSTLSCVIISCRSYRGADSWCSKFLWVGDLQTWPRLSRDWLQTGLKSQVIKPRRSEGLKGSTSQAMGDINIRPFLLQASASIPMCKGYSALPSVDLISTRKVGNVLASTSSCLPCLYEAKVDLRLWACQHCVQVYRERCLSSSLWTCAPLSHGKDTVTACAQDTSTVYNVPHGYEDPKIPKRKKAMP